MRTPFLLILLLCSLRVSAQTQVSDKYALVLDSLRRAGQKEKIIPYLRQELLASPQNESVLRWLGYVHIENQELDLGEKYYRDALSVNPACARCYLNIARIYGIKLEYEKSAEYIETALRMDPNDGLIYSVRAKWRELTGDITGASADRNMAIEKDPQNPEYYVERGHYNAQRNFFLLALNDMKKAIDLDPKNPYPYQQRAQLYNHKKRYEEALADLNTAIALDSTMDVLYTGRGAVYAGMQQYEMAIANYSKGIQLNPDEFSNYYNRALAKFELEDMQGTCDDYHSGLQILVKKNGDARIQKEIEAHLKEFCDSTVASYYYQAGISYYNRRQFDKAVHIYTRGLKKFPNHPMLSSFRGNAYLALKKYKEALPDYYAAVKSPAGVKEALLANTRYSNTSADSVELFLNSFLVDNYSTIAESQFALGRYDEAIKEINRAIALAPRKVGPGKKMPYNVRGSILLAMGKPSEAQKDFDHAIAIDPSYPLAYINRAIAKMNLAKPLKLRTYSIHSSVMNPAFNAYWILPPQTSVAANDAHLLSALADCDKALELAPSSDYAWYVRGRIKKMLSDPPYCADLIKANELGYVVEPELLQSCKK